jgi:DNA-binding MarR family transcriptional regulator
MLPGVMSLAHDSIERSPSRLWQLPSWLLAQAALRGQRITAARFDVLGMRRQHFAILSALADGGPASQAELARELRIDRSDMVEVLGELERAGLVRRARDASDRRRNAVTLTPAGVYALGQLDAQVEDAQRQLLAPLSAAERAQLTWLLTRLVEHHTEQR